MPSRVYLVHSLQTLRREIDVKWPNRNRGIDGWYRACKFVGGSSSDHCYDSSFRVHAIDVDRRGIDAEWLFRHLMDSSLPTHYVIWNRRIANRDSGWRIRAYHGTSNPHTDHVHISILHADWARNWQDSWRVAHATTGFGDAPTETAEAPWDYRPSVAATAGQFNWLGSSAYRLGRSARSIRR